jgi:hypothetical protein
MKWARKRGAINDERKLEPSAVNSARKERGGGGGGGDRRESADGGTGEDGELGVGYETHRSVVVPLYPHLDHAGDVVERGWQGSGLAGGLCLRGRCAEWAQRGCGQEGEDLLDKFGNDVGAEKGESVEEGEGGEGDDGDCGVS